jgi:hypothetical protein
VSAAARRVVGACAAALAVCACDNPSVHVYSAQAYDPQGHCVEPSSTALDVISGAATGNDCPATCIVGSGQVFVSVVCPPYPPGYGVETADSGIDPSDPCSGALAAYAAGITCGAATGDAGAADGGDADAPAE